MSEQEYVWVSNPPPPTGPGTPAHEAWLLAGQSVRVPAEESKIVEYYFDGIYSHTITRNQNSEELNKVADKLKDIWVRFDNKQIESAQFLQELEAFKSVDMLTPHLTDELTRQFFVECITKLESEANA